jgi:hypothetical protein
VLRDAVARELALELSLQFEEADFEALSPLVDASLVWLDEEARAPIAAAVAGELWPRELREDIERGLGSVATRSKRLRRAVALGRRDLANGPQASRLARAVVDQAADELAFDLQLPVGCPHCMELGAAADEDGRRELALALARMSGPAARIPGPELRAAMVVDDPALALANDERRAEARWWLRRIAVLGKETLPTLSAALLELLDQPLPAVEDDEIWAAAVAGLAKQLALRMPM